MRWKISYSSAKAPTPFEWHRWFAWHPVTIDGRRVWLERVYRKLVQVPYGAEYEYRFGK